MPRKSTTEALIAQAQKLKGKVNKTEQAISAMMEPSAPRVRKPRRSTTQYLTDTAVALKQKVKELKKNVRKTRSDKGKKRKPATYAEVLAPMGAMSDVPVIAGAKKPRKTRSDKGVKRGSRSKLS